MEMIKEFGKFLMWCVGICFGLLGLFITCIFGLVALAFLAEIFKILTLDLIVPALVVMMFVFLTIKLYEKLFKPDPS